MTDVFSEKKRSEIMSRIRSKNSKAEKLVFSYLRREGIYFQKHYARTHGKPDVASPHKKIAVFIDGDFWHGRDYQRVLNVTKSVYWTAKIKGNMERDKKNSLELASEGWQVLRVWESDVNRKNTRDKTLQEIKDFLTS